jgi:GntR family transcriptional regulator / MocR family aminotransferase
MRRASLPLFIERGTRTLQEQIYRGIRQSILDGLVSADRRLPSTRSLAADLGVSRTTALLALEQLRAEGYLIARPGSGTFIAPRLPAPPAMPVNAPGKPIARPPFSRRGQLLARMQAPDRRASVPPRAFRLGTPALDLFPWRLWAQITRECLRDRAATHLDYSPLAGLRALREAIAEQMQARGTRCDPDQVQVVAGAQRGMDLIARMLLDPGDAVLMEDPGYTGARGAWCAAGASVTPIPVDGDGMVVTDGRAPDARLAYVTPSCQFPLGVALSVERRLALLDWARRAQAWIVEDDYDCDLRFDRQPLPCLHSLDPDGRVIYLGTFSKTLFPALRLGFLIVPRDLQSGFIAARLATELHPPVLEQRVLAAFIQRGHYERHLRRMQAAYAERLDAVRRAVDRSGAPLRMRPVRAGMHAVLDVDGVNAERVHTAAAAAGVESMPLSSYYFGGGRPPNALFVGFGAAAPPAIRAGVNTLARVIEAIERDGTCSQRSDRAGDVATQRG